MKSKRPTRGYLSQLAEPAMPGQRLVTPRRTRVESVPLQFEIPVVEEIVDVVRQSSRKATRAPFVLDVSTVDAAAPAIARSERATPPAVEPAVTTKSNERMAADARQQNRRAPISEPPQPKQSHLQERDSEIAAVPRNVQSSKAVSPADIQTASPGGPEESLPKPEESRLRPQSSRQADVPTSPMSAFAPAARSDSEPPQPPWRVIQQPAIPDLNRDATSETKTSQRARVHIGTIEIRATAASSPTPQPVAAVVATPVQNQPLRAPSTTATGDSLSRGLAWTFGLVQG